MRGRCGGCAGRRGRSGFHPQARGAVGLALQLRVLRGCKQMGVEEIVAEERFERDKGRAGKVILGHITRGVTPEKGEVRARLQRDRTDKQIPQGGVDAAIFAQREFHERAVGHGGAEQIEEAVEGGRLRHGIRGELGGDRGESQGTRSGFVAENEKSFSFAARGGPGRFRAACGATTGPCGHGSRRQ